MFKRPETPEDKQAFREKARLSFAELAEQDEMELIAFKSFIVAAEHMDEVEAMRKDGKKSWTSKISAIRVGYWKAYDVWARIAHPELFAKPVAPKRRKDEDDDDDDDFEEKEEYVPDMTMPTEPVNWEDVLVWKETEDYPFIRDTEFTSENINCLFDEGWPLEKIMKCHPTLTMRDMIACQEYEKVDMPARKKYEEEYFDKQRMSPLHPNFEVAPWYPKDPKPQYGPGPAIGFILACAILFGGLVSASRVFVKQQGDGGKVEVVQDRAETGEGLALDDAKAEILGGNRQESGEKTVANRLGRNAERGVKLQERALLLVGLAARRNGLVLRRKHAVEERLGETWKIGQNRQKRRAARIAEIE